MMKHLVYIYSIVILFFLSACSDVCDTDFTPEIETLNYWLYPINRTNDSVRILKIASQKLDTLHYDTISVGDTVFYMVELDARTSVLTSFKLSQKDSVLAMELLLTDEQYAAIEDSSKVEEGLIYFQPKWGRASLAVKYVALRTGADTVSMRVASTSKFSPKYLHFCQPVK